MSAKSIILLGVGLWTAFCAFQFWSSRPGNRPSSFFQQLDRSHDSSVSFIEWEAEHRRRTHWPGREWDFHHMDCNQDQRLTWQEYRNSVFKRRDCEPARVESARPLAPGSFSQCWQDAVSGAQRCVITNQSSP